METFLRRLLDRASMRLAVVGDGAGNVSVPGRANFIYARLGGADGEVIETRATTLNASGGALAEGDVLYVMLENPAAPREWRTVWISMALV